MTVKIFFISLTLFIFSTTSFSAETLIAVASNFTAPAKALAVAFNKKTGHKAILSFGSTGKLFTQISHGAPFDVFLAADTQRPRKAIDEGLATGDFYSIYARGRLVLFSLNKELIDPEGNVLNAKKIKRLAIANPKTAPYGVAAKEVLKKIAPDLKSKLIMGENIAQTYQFVITRNVPMGFVALSQVIGQTEGSMWLIPESLHSPLNQAAVLLNKGHNNTAAVAFMHFLKSQAAKNIIEQYGYQVE